MMAYWHDDEGKPCKPFHGRFDPSHLWPLLLLLPFVAQVLYKLIHGEHR